MQTNVLLQNFRLSDLEDHTTKMVVSVLMLISAMALISATI